MPEAVPYTTGNEILAYKGDPNLAAGASSGQILPQQGNPFSGIQNTIDRVNENQAQMNVLKYHQKLKDQNDLAQALASTGNSVFNMKGENGQNLSFNPLPEDQKALDDKAKEVRETIFANPDKYMFSKDYLQKLSEFNTLKSHAGLRSVAFSKYNSEAAQSNDPNERASILGMRDAEIKGHSLEDFHMPEPHLPHFTYNPEEFIPSKDTGNEKNQNTYSMVSGKDAQGNLVHTSMSGINDNLLDFRNKVLPGSTKYANALNLANSYVQSIQSNPDAVTQHNNSIDAINRQRGYVDQDGNPVSPHYIPHIAEIETDANGQSKVVLKNQNPADIAYSIMAEKNGALQPSKEIKKDAVDIKKEETETQYKKGEAQQRQADLEEKIRHNKKEEQIQFAKGQKETAAEREAETGGMSANLEVFKKFNDWSNGGKPLSKIATTDMKSVEGLGINKGDYNWKEIPNDEYVKNLFSKEAVDVKGKATGVLENPRYVVFLSAKNGNPKDGKLVGFFGKDQKDQKPVVLPANAAVENSILSESRGAKPTSKQIVTQEKARDYFSKEDNIWNGGKNTSAPSKQATAAAPVRKTISGTTYEKGDDGKWYKI